MNIEIGPTQNRPSFNRVAAVHSILKQNLGSIVLQTKSFFGYSEEPEPANSKVQCVKVTPFDKSAIRLAFFATWVGVARVIS